MNFIKIAVVITATMLVACGKFGLYSGDNSTVVAKVGGVELRSSALDHIYSGALSVEDSLAIREVYINSWVRDEVKRQAAEKAIEQSGESADQIEQMVKKYRTQLLVYKFEREFLDSRVDTTITSAQIEEYYKENTDNFRLAGPLVKAVVVRLPAGLRQSKRLEEMFLKPRGGSSEEFINICQKNDYRVDDFSGEWTDFSVVLQHIPFGQKSFDDFLKSKSYYEVMDDTYKYMMRIDGYLPTGALSPEARERDNIIKILHNLRRRELLKNLDDSLMKIARSKNVIFIEK